MIERYEVQVMRSDGRWDILRICCRFMDAKDFCDKCRSENQEGTYRVMQKIYNEIY